VNTYLWFGAFVVWLAAVSWFAWRLAELVGACG